jgi:Ca-activated chloride channel family protein
MIVPPLPPTELDRLRDPEAGLGALATERGNLPLEAVEVRAAVTGLLARTTLTQTFANAFDEPLEATYIFPLPPRAAVTEFRMAVADRVVTGTLAERGEARARYEEAIEAGRRAAIAEQERPDVFTVRVGNLLPGETAEVTLVMAGPLPWVDGAATFRFPLVVAPRYIPGLPLPEAPAGSGTSPDTDAVPDASRITPPVLLPGFPNPVRLAVTVELDPAGLPLGAVSSSLHTVMTGERDGRRVLEVTPGERPDRDVVIRYELGAEAVATALTLAPDGDGDGDGTFALTVLPPAADPATATGPSHTGPDHRFVFGAGRPRDVVFVLDRSGSMGGWKMVAARRAAARMIDGLGERDRFAVLAFDNVVEQAPGLPAGRLVAATDRDRFRAVEFLAGLAARGGTELAGPLATALDLLGEDPGGRDRVLVLVTDGQVGNEDQILARVAPRLPGVRVFTVGIDRAVNEGFLDRLAGSGAFELVESEDRLDAAMDRIHRRLATPVVTGLAVEAAGLAIDQASIAPARLPDLFPGAPVIITGRWTGQASGAVTVTGRLASGERWLATVPVAAGANGAAAPVWARARLRDLEDRWAVAGDQALEREIVATSLRWGVLSRFTAFVAVDTRVVNEGGRQRTVTQPVHAPSGWEMEQAQPSTVYARAMAAGAAAAPAHILIAPKGRPPAGGRGREKGRGILDALAGYGPEGPLAPPQPAKEEAAARPVGSPRTAAAELLALLERGRGDDVADALRRLADALAALLAALTLGGAGRDQTARVARLHERAAALLAGPTAVDQVDPGELDRLWREAEEVARLLAGARGGRAFWRRRPR